MGELRLITNKTFETLNQSDIREFAARSKVLTDVEPLAFAHFRQLETLDLSFNPLLGFANASRSWYGLQYTNISTLLLKRSVPYDYELITIKRSFYKYLKLTRLKKLVS